LAYTQDDGFHEIQLNGKQLVFLFMAATVVSVVIFLCGVLVGRGVRAERGDLVQTSATDVSTDVAPAPPAGASVTPPAPAATATTGDPSTAAAPSLDELSYFNRLEKPNAPAEKLKPAGEKTAPEKSTTEKSASKPAAAKAEPKPDPKLPEPKLPEPKTSSVAVAPPPPPPPAPAQAPPLPVAGKEASSGSPAAGQGWVVQVAALNVRSEADAVAKRLGTKGYTTYVDALPDRTPPLFRVRVGAFKSKREADAAAAKLKKEEQVTQPWVTR